MNFTLHLTTDCNLRCSYCYSPPKKAEEMDAFVAKNAVAFASEISPKSAGIIFFGGEPLLKKDIIIEAVEYGKKIQKKESTIFHFKITSNGLLLDKDFLEYSLMNSIYISISIDGIKEAHDYHRKDALGKGSFDKVIEKVKLLLEYQPYANALMVVTPETVKYFYESFKFLIEFGFRYIIASLNYAGNWDDESLETLREEYKKIADLYEELTLNEHKFYFSPFEKKLASYIMSDQYENYICHFGVRQISIAPNGDVYPCVQFVKAVGSTKKYKIGDIWKGIDKEKQMELYNKSRTLSEACMKCKLRDRCENKCACIKFQTTGEIDKIPPILCEHERIIIPIVDKLGEKLFEKRAPMFIQKHYNGLYPLISFFEDIGNEIIKNERS